MFNDSQFRKGGTNLGCFPVGGWLTTPTSPPVYGPGGDFAHAFWVEFCEILVQNFENICDW